MTTAANSATPDAKPGVAERDFPMSSDANSYHVYQEQPLVVPQLAQT